MYLTADFVSSDEAARRAGCSYRQLDYWCRTGAITPTVGANGSGSTRRWAPDDVALLRVFHLLAGLGAEQPVLFEVAAAVTSDPGLWDSTVLVTQAGLVVKLYRCETLADVGTAAGWVVDLAGCRAAAEGL